MKYQRILPMLMLFLLGFVISTDPLVPLIETSPLVPTDITIIIFSFINQDLLTNSLSQEHKDAYKEAFRRFRTKETKKVFSSYDASIEFFAIEFLDSFISKNAILMELLFILRPKCVLREFAASIIYQETWLAKKIIIDRFLGNETLCQQCCQEIATTIGPEYFEKDKLNKELPTLMIVGKKMGDFTLKVLVKALKKFKIPVLYLTNNQITDISPLSSLSSLEILDLSQNQITEISALASLSNLVNLILSKNQISDIAPLALLSKLENLNLSNNRIAQVSPLASISALRILFLTKNQVTDISPLSYLSNLQFLNLSQNLITDVSALSSLFNINDLNLSGNQKIDVSKLASLLDLASLRLTKNQATKISSLSNLKWLTIHYT